MTDSTLAGFFALDVKPEFRHAFVDASIYEAQCVVSEEPGVFQFHVMVDETNPNRFYFFEVFRDQHAIQGHRETEAFTNWLNRIEPMLDGDIETVARMRSLFPTKAGFEAQKPGLLQW